jgi:hypothetical protein
MSDLVKQQQERGAKLVKLVKTSAEKIKTAFALLEQAIQADDGTDMRAEINALVAAMAKDAAYNLRHRIERGHEFISQVQAFAYLANVPEMPTAPTLDKLDMLLAHNVARVDRWVGNIVQKAEQDTANGTAGKLFDVEAYECKQAQKYAEEHGWPFDREEWLADYRARIAALNMKSKKRAL